MSSSSLLDSRLLMVTGKGGVGKTTFAASLARLKAAKGQRTVLCEIDAQRPAMGSIFNCEVGYKPTEVSERLSVCNLTWTEALVTYLQRSLPVSGLVRRILDNEVVNRFLDFTPGSRELAILSRVGQLVESYDAVVIDMPASGHAYSLLAAISSIQALFRVGPVRERANELTGLLSEDRTRVVFVALPEELVVTETLETLVRFREGGLLGGPPLLYLNRGTAPTLTEDEDALITGLSGLSLPQEAATLVRAGRWERELELGTQMALERLTEGFGSAPEVVGVRPAGGTQRQVVEHVAVVLGRPVGLTRRVLSWC